jgi:hypothetical protein
MNDTELITMVRESVADVHAATPVARIISRGRAVRARRRMPGVAGALAMSAGTALAVAALLPSGHPALLPASRPASDPAVHPASHPASARLAAWTVARQANGDIDVTINQLQNPAGLQATLRADGLPVNVTFSGSMANSSCQHYVTSDTDVLNAVAQFHANDGSSFLVIDPSALPSGTGLAIFDEPGAGVPTPSPGTPTHGPGLGSPPSPPAGATRLPVSAPAGPTGLPTSAPAGITGPLAVGLVYASPQCTG